MKPRLVFTAFLCVAAVRGEVKTKLYSDPEGCFRTYRLAAGRVLTSRGLIEDPTVNAIMQDAVSVQMNGLNIRQVKEHPDLEIRFMGGNGAGLQVDDMSVGDVAMWDIGGPPGVSGKTYKKSNLVIAVVDDRSGRTIWAARCTDKFGDPARLRERIEKAVSKAFTKFPKKSACS